MAAENPESEKVDAALAAAERARSARSEVAAYVRSHASPLGRLAARLGEERDANLHWMEYCDSRTCNLVASAAERAENRRGVLSGMLAEFLEPDAEESGDLLDFEEAHDDRKAALEDQDSEVHKPAIRRLSQGELLLYTADLVAHTHHGASNAEALDAAALFICELRHEHHTPEHTEAFARQVRDG
jgi:hypothetical protein